MGAFHSSSPQSPPSVTSSSQEDGLSKYSSVTSVSLAKARKSRRILDKIRRQSSKSDEFVQTSNADDPINYRVAQNRDKDFSKTADLDQIILELRDDEESAKNNNKSEGTPSKEKPVFNEDRHIITCDTTTHTTEHTEATESTKHDADKAVSCSSTATNERSFSEDFERKTRESSDKKTFSDQFPCEDCHIILETESWKTAKNWKSVGIRTDQGVLSSHGNVIVIREAPPTSSSDSDFTDPDSQPNDEVTENLNLTIKKLEQLSFCGDQQNLQIVRHESLNFDGESSSEECVEMPILKKRLEQVQPENGNDKGIFSVSRVKKVELSEIPLATDICATSPPEPQTVTLQTPTKSSGSGNNNKASNGSGKVLHRVISLTAANHDNLSGKAAAKQPPSYVPEKLHFSAYEKFEGQMLVNWFIQSIQSIASSMTISLNESDQNTLALQYCTNLLKAGVIKQLDAALENVDCFKPNSMYQWMQHQAIPTPMTPGKLETSVIWSHASDKRTSPKSREGESKIPKLLSSTPKARIQLVSSLLTMNDQSHIALPLGAESDQNKLKELKIKMSKCETIQDMLVLVKGLISEHSMQSSESSTNSGIFSGSVLNGSENTVFDRSMESTVFNVLHQRPLESSMLKVQTPPKNKTVKARTSPSTPTGRADPTKRIRRNLSDNSVSSSASTSTLKPTDFTNGTCKRCAQKLTSPVKISDKRMVDKATVMDVEPLSLIIAKELKSIETQTETEINVVNSDEKQTDALQVAPPPPPPPPPMSNIPPPPPPPCPSAPKIPGPPPPPPPGINSSIPAPPNLPPMAPTGLLTPMPLPPPIALNSGQGKLLSQTSNTSSSSAANGKPKPLPMIPASEFYLTNTLRKNAVNPPKPMKPLYWTRIVAPIKSADVTDGPQTASSATDEKKDDSEEDEELWKKIDETKLDNLDEFTELFSRQGVVPKAKTETPLPKIKAIKVLDSKRSQNVGIFERSLHYSDFSEIEHAIYHCDTSVVSLETLQHIMEIKATNEELTMIKEAIANHTEGSPPLDVPENFLLKISQISSSAERISCIVFTSEFEEQCTMVSRKLTTVKSVCEFLLENDGLKEVFSIILTLGNFMNGGNRQRGQADGFGLEILGKLKDVKSKDPKITLLHFIVKTYIERCRKGGCSISDLVLPVPNPNDVEKCLAIDFEECKQQLNALKAKVDECKKTAEKVVRTSPENCVQPFKQKMEEFIEMAKKKIDNRCLKLGSTQLHFIKTIKFYKFMAKKGTIEETAPAQFFEYWTSFTSDFNDIFKKEILMLSNEILKKTRQKTKPQSKPITGENNLKARINRLKNRNV